MKTQIMKNLVYQVSYQLLLRVMPIITIPIISRALGPSGIGTYNYINSIVQYFVLVAGLGLATYGVREIAIARESKETLSRKFWEIQIFNMLFATLILMLYFIFAFLTGYTMYFLIMSMVLFGTLFDISWFFAGIEDFKYITIIGAVIKVVSFLVIIFFIRTQDDLVLYFVVKSLSILLIQVSLWLFVFKRVNFVKIKLKEVFRHFKPALAFFVGRVAITLYTNVNVTVLGLLASMTLVGIFSNSIILVTTTIVIVTTLDVVMLPRMTKMVKDKEEKETHILLSKTIHLQLFFTIPICIGLIAINNQMIPWFFGEEFLMLRKTVPVLAPLIVMISLGTSVSRQYLVPRNKIREKNISVICGAAVAIVLSLSLIPYINIWGAIVATFAAELTVLVMRLKFMIREINFRFDWRRIFSYLVSGGVMYLVIWIVTREMHSSPATTLLQIAIGFVVYFTLTKLMKVNGIDEFVKEKHI